MSHKVNYHQLNDSDNRISIAACDDPGPGGACTHYAVTTPLAGDQPHLPRKRVLANIEFQRGNPHEGGFNGVTNEVLLAILIDRMHGFQEGPYPTEQNERALSHCTLALEALHERTRERNQRGVEGQTVQ